MTERIFGLPVRVNPDMPRNEIWICEQLATTVSVEGAAIRFTERYKILARELAVDPSWSTPQKAVAGNQV